ncbi:putative membrane protein [Methanofollis sp. W23]|uniref:TMEM175 family protein n=1 Tax=Methanofollis sp. W23 TaxID=2817849 RepID=UPI001AE77B4C|nr:TMEM175 family protein [Methanofollis sp. W23]MBP2146759.1 putative membrane protein [Methanofollis sp. W23]
MSTEPAYAGWIGFSKNRFEALTDGIFGIAMTLLVVGLSVPAVATITGTVEIEETLSSLFPDFVHYCIAFLILHGMWVSHHALSQKMEYIDRRFLDLNSLLLLSVAIIPFSTSFAGDFPESPVAAMVLEVNLLAVGGFLLAQWTYVASNTDLLRPGIHQNGLSPGMRLAAVIPVLSFLGIAAALLGSAWSTGIYLLVPAAIFVIKRLSQIKENEDCQVLV